MESIAKTYTVHIIQIPHRTMPWSPPAADIPIEARVTTGELIIRSN